MSTVSTQVDFVVAGLGALGSATAYELASRGHRVVGLERFELGHDRGASHDTSRILRHSYHTPAYVRLTQEAYADWARLERASGAALVTKVGGLDLFPPRGGDPADRLRRLARRGRASSYEVLDAADVAARWPQFGLPRATRWRSTRRDAAIVPAARGTRTMQEQATRARRRAARRTARSPACATWAIAASRSRPTRARSGAGGSWSARTRGSTTCWPAWACRSRSRSRSSR